MGFGYLARNMRRAGAVAVATALLFTTSAYAAPTTDSAIDVQTDSQTQSFREELTDKQQKVEDLKDQLDQLDQELEVAAEQYNEAVDQLAELKEKAESVQGDLDKAQEAYDLQSEILGERANSIYKDGSLASIEILLGSKSVSDFMSRVKFLNTIGIADADIASSLESQKADLEQQMDDLENTEELAESLQFEMKARKIEVMLRIQERQDLLSDTEDDIVALLEEEATRRSSEDAELLSEILSGANAKGIVVESGSPVETALAYHGVPYLWGGESPAGFDCSGLVLYIFAQHGVTLPHYSGSQFRLGEKVDVADLQPGDVVFFGSPIHHVGIYIGGGYFIHAPKTGDYVKISKLADRSDYAGARRYDWTYREGEPKNAVVDTSEALDSVSQ